MFEEMLMYNAQTLLPLWPYDYITNYVKALKANLLGEGGWGNLRAEGE